MSGFWPRTPSDWLAEAARRLGVRDPVAALGDVARFLPACFDDDPGNALVPGFAPLEVSFCEVQPEALRLDFEPAAGGAPEEVARLAHARFGRDRALELAAARDRLVELPHEGRSFDAFVGAAIDAHGLSELSAYVPAVSPGWAVEAARSELTSLEPLMHSLSVSSGGVQTRTYLVARAATYPAELHGLLARLGLARRAPEVALTLRRLLDGAPIFPPGTLVVGVRERPDGVELKLEVALAGVGRAPRVAELLAERPASRAAFERWSRAIAQNGAPSVASVVSVRVAPSHGSRLSLYVHPEPAPPEVMLVGDSHAARVG